MISNENNLGEIQRIQNYKYFQRYKHDTIVNSKLIFIAFFPSFLQCGCACMCDGKSVQITE